MSACRYPGRPAPNRDLIGDGMIRVAAVGDIHRVGNRAERGRRDPRYRGQQGLRRRLPRALRVSVRRAGDERFIRHSRRLADGLAEALADLKTDVKVALTHYAPVPGTLAGEPLEIYPFLGSYFLAEAADGVPADMMIHGHAHAGTECG